MKKYSNLQDNILIICDDDNIGSCEIIGANVGLLEKNRKRSW